MKNIKILAILMVAFFSIATVNAQTKTANPAPQKTEAASKTVKHGKKHHKRIHARKGHHRARGHKKHA